MKLQFEGNIQITGGDKGNKHAAIMHIAENVYCTNQVELVRTTSDKEVYNLLASYYDSDFVIIVHDYESLSDERKSELKRYMKRSDARFIVIGDCGLENHLVLEDYGIGYLNGEKVKFLSSKDCIFVNKDLCLQFNRPFVWLPDCNEEEFMSTIGNYYDQEDVTNNDVDFLVECRDGNIRDFGYKDYMDFEANEEVELSRLIKFVDNPNVDYDLYRRTGCYVIYTGNEKPDSNYTRNFS